MADDVDFGDSTISVWSLSALVIRLIRTNCSCGLIGIILIDTEKIFWELEEKSLKIQEIPQRRSFTNWGKSSLATDLMIIRNSFTKNSSGSSIGDA